MSLCKAANFIRSRVLIDLIRSGQRTVEVTVATPYFRALQPGDRVNFTQRHKVGSYSELVCEIVERQHFHTVGELLKAVGVERVVGAGKQRRRDRRDRDDDESAEAGVILQGNLSALDAVSEFGVLAFHLKVVEDEFSECEEAHHYRVLHLPELQQIARGEKTIDARVILTHKRAVIPGDSIVFRYSRNQVEMDEWRLTCKAVAVKRYATFRELLEAEGIERCVPGCSNLEKAIEMCHRSGLGGKNSRQSEQKHGVIAIHLQPISTLTEVAAASDERKKSRW